MALINSKKIIKKLTIWFLEYRGYKLVPIVTFNELIKIYFESKLIDYGIVVNKEVFNNELSKIDFNNVKSQFGQDLFTLKIFDYKRNGYFVEFGVSNGIDLSNTYLLESIGWDGIIVEPSRDFKFAKKNRNCKSYNLAVFSESNTLIDFIYNGDRSTLMPFKNSDTHNRKYKRYKVRTITLEELLEEANAPSYIDYISIDTEGSEFEILKDFDFNKFKFGIITVEHNFVEKKRNMIYELLSKNNYVRVLKNLTQVDDWYMDSKLYLERKYLFLRNEHENSSN